MAIGIDLDWTQRRAGAVDFGQRGRQVLAGEGADRAAQRGVEDVFIACVDGLKGFPSSDEDGVSPGAGAVVHRAPGAGQSEARSA